MHRCGRPDAQQHKSAPPESPPPLYLAGRPLRLVQLLLQSFGQNSQSCMTCSRCCISAELLGGRPSVACLISARQPLTQSLRCRWLSQVYKTCSCSPLSTACWASGSTWTAGLVSAEMSMVLSASWRRMSSCWKATRASCLSATAYSACTWGTQARQAGLSVRTEEWTCGQWLRGWPSAPWQRCRHLEQSDVSSCTAGCCVVRSQDAQSRWQKVKPLSGWIACKAT